MVLRQAVEWFRTGPDRAPPLSDRGAIDREYRRLRFSVFWSVTLGYALFYVARVNFSVVKKPLLDENLMSATEMGVIGSAMLAVYAFGKFFNGFLADRANIRRFMSASLLCAACVNLVLGFTTWFWAFAVLWGLNGWFQSVGSAPSVVSLSQWFSPHELGTRYGLWSVSHSLGEGLSFVVTAALVSWMGWRWGFWWPGLVCAAAAFVLFRTLADRPATYGLPPVTDWRNDHPQPAPVAAAPASRESVGALQKEVLRNPAIWVLGLAGATMSATRYGVMNWGMLFLQEDRRFSMTEAGAILSVYPIAALAGAALSGIVSDRLFGSRRNIPALLMGLMVTGSLMALVAAPAPAPWLDAWAEAAFGSSLSGQLMDSAVLALFGFNMGGLLTYLGGLMAVDLSPKRAAGAAMGVSGMFCYLGAAAQDTVSGWLIDQGRTVVDGFSSYDFTPVLTFWIGCSLISILMTLLVWNARPRE